jgi:hypothetical protein
MFQRNIHRRHGPDKLIKRLDILTFLTWGVSILVAYMIAFARPPVESVFYRWHKSRLGNEWDEFMLQYSIIFMFICFFLSTGGLFINRFRHKRKTDHYRYSLIMLTILSLAGIVIHFMFI